MSLNIDWMIMYNDTIKKYSEDILFKQTLTKYCETLSTTDFYDKYVLPKIKKNFRDEYNLRSIAKMNLIHHIKNEEHNEIIIFGNYTNNDNNTKYCIGENIIDLNTNNGSITVLLYVSSQDYLTCGYVDKYSNIKLYEDAQNSSNNTLNNNS